MPVWCKHEDGTDWTHVVAAAVFDTRGRVLIARRPEHKAHGGLWEFPGGKREPGESPGAALKRELCEELGIEPRAGHRLIRIRHRYDRVAVVLDVWSVHEFSGTPTAREGQSLAWTTPSALSRFEFPAANDPIVSALALPQVVLVTPEIAGTADPLLDLIAERAAAGVGCVQLRPDPVTRRHDPQVAARVREICQESGARFFVNGTIGEALTLGAEGVHLSERRLRSMPAGQWPEGLCVGASCHSPMALEHAARLGLDYATLAPVKPTASHPGRAHLGWHRVLAWTRRARLPVYALGGLGPGDLGRAVLAGCQGIAMIRGALKDDALGERLASEQDRLRALKL